jgi:hypothetical protein
MEREAAGFRAANERITTMAEGMRKAELVCDRLEGLSRLMGSYPEGHDMQERLETLHVERALEGVEEDIRVLTDALQHTPAAPKPRSATGGSRGALRRPRPAVLVA